jgi:hypothetical protein
LTIDIEARERLLERAGRAAEDLDITYGDLSLRMLLRDLIDEIRSGTCVRACCWTDDAESGNPIERARSVQNLYTLLTRELCAAVLTGGVLSDAAEKADAVANARYNAYVLSQSID